MKSSKLIEMLKKGNFVVPLYLFQLRKKFNLSFEEFMFLVYLTNLGEQILFNPSKLANDLGLSLEEVMSYIETLTDKNYISLDVIKNEKNVMDEYIVLNMFYEKLTNFMIDDINQSKEEETASSNVYEKI